jgi:hypothetical protein
VIPIVAHGWPQFLTVHAILRDAGVDVIASGGNDMSVPDDTPVDVLRQVAAAGATVHADLTKPAQPEPDPEPKPARKSRRRKTTEE